MKKLHSLAFYALLTPAITFGAGSVLAEQSTDQNVDREQSAQQDWDAEQLGTHPAKEGAQSDQDAKQSTSKTTQSDQQRTGDYDSHPAIADAENNQDAKQYDAKTAASDQSRMQNRGYMDAAPANGMQASDLIGAEVSTSADETVGSVSDLIIDENGQVVAIIVGVGGFLGMGERDVAIGWDDVTRSGASDDQELRINATREDLSAAPAYETQD